MDKIDWSTIYKRFGAIPLIVTVALLFIAFNAGVWRWLGQATNATAIEGFFAIVQGLFTLALIVLTFLTVRANNEMARANKNMARANAEMAQQTELMAQETKRMAEVQVEQQRAAIRPVLVIRLRPHSGFADFKLDPMVDRFDVEVANVGVGPALETTVDYRGPFNYTMDLDEVLPFTVAQHEAIVVRFKLDEDTPFTDPKNPMRWPRTDEDKELIQQLEDNKKEGRTNFPEYSQRRHEHRKRQIRYLKDLTAHIADKTSAGRVIVKYRDLIDNEYTSSASVVIEDRGEVQESEDDEDAAKHDSFYPTWSPVTLRALSIKVDPKEEFIYGEGQISESKP